MFFFPNAKERNDSQVFWGWKSGEKEKSGLVFCFLVTLYNKNNAIAYDKNNAIAYGSVRVICPNCRCGMSLRGDRRRRGRRPPNP